LCRLPFYLSTVITQSGQTVAQNAQPMHFSCSFTPAGWYPFAFRTASSIAMIFFGQTFRQSLQPLQRSTLKVTFAIKIILHHLVERCIAIFCGAAPREQNILLSQYYITVVANVQVKKLAMQIKGRAKRTETKESLRERLLILKGRAARKLLIINY